MFMQKVHIPILCLMPAFILHKPIIGTEVYGHRLAAMRTERQKLGRYAHIALLFNHFSYYGLIIKCLLTAWCAALEQTIIPLRIEKALYRIRPSESNDQRLW